jgi:ribonuclease T1
MRKILLLVGLLALVSAFQGEFGQGLRDITSGSESGRSVSAQQSELETTLALIKRGGPFPYRRDGLTFENRERLLPARPSGYYREYTVPTPGLSHRGARRIVAGGDPPVVFYYTEDHYRSFRRIDGQ